MSQRPLVAGTGLPTAGSIIKTHETPQSVSSAKHKSLGRVASEDEEEELRRMREGGPPSGHDQNQLSRQ